MRLRRLYQFSQIFLLLMIVFFLSAIVSSRVIQSEDIVSVPDLSGKTVTEARSELIRRHLSLHPDDEEFSDRFEKGRIIRQVPSAGSKIRVNRTVNVVLSAGTEMVEVPQFTGRSLEAVVKTLTELGLTRGKISHIHTAQYAAGRIIAQDPAPSSKIKRTTPIHFLVSQGEGEPKYLMPDLIGKRAAATVRQLSQLGFRVADIRYAYYPGREAGIIIKQFPAQGYSVAKRSLISLEVSR